MRIRVTVFAVLTALALTAGACASDDSDESTDEPTEEAEESGTEAEATEEDEETDAEAEEATDDDDATEDDDVAAPNSIIVIETDIGEVLATDEELVLYVFDEDGEAESNCVDVCADFWPPLDGGYTWPDTVTVDTGSFERADGTEQAWVAALPVYTFDADTAGTTNGQGSGDSWWTLNPDGSVNRSTS